MFKSWWSEAEMGTSELLAFTTAVVSFVAAVLGLLTSTIALTSRRRQRPAEERADAADPEP
jgi:hypothetical protein